MQFVSDYTTSNHENNNADKIFKENGDMLQCGSQKELELYMEYCRTRDSQYEIRPSRLKQEQVFAVYEQLKELAFIQEGKVILNIDEKKMRSKILYWGKTIILLSGESEKIFKSLEYCETVYIEAERGGIHLCIQNKLFDEIKIEDKACELLKMKELINKCKDQ